jgi:hypothetical protein
MSARSRRRRLRGTAFAAAALTLVTALPAVARAQAPAAGLVFRDARQLTLSWDAAVAGAAAGEVCNTATATAVRVHPVAEGFAFTRAAKPIADAQRVTAEIGGRSSLRPGGCRTVTVRVRGTVDAGSYAGLVTVTSAGAGATRRPVTIAGPADKLVEVAPKATFGSAPLNAHRAFPFAAQSTLTDDGTLRVRAAAKGQKLRFAPACPSHRRLDQAIDDELRALRTDDRKRTKAARLDLEAKRSAHCPFVGNLVNGDDVAQVFADGRLILEEQRPARLALRIEGAGSIGTYEGALDLARTPLDDTDDVKVKVTVTDSVGWAVLALLAGALLALLSQYIRRRWWPKHGLLDRARGFKPDYEAAKAVFDEHAPEYDSFGAPSQIDVDRYVEAIATAIRRYGRSVVWFDDTSAAYAQLDASLDQVEADIGIWSDKAGLARALRELDSALGEVESFVRQERLLPASPALVVGAALLLRPRRLQVGQASELVKQLDARSGFVAQWLTIARRAKRYVAWQLALLRHADRMTDAEQGHLHAAGDGLAVVLYELLDARDADDLERLRTEHDLQGAYELLARLAPAYGWIPAATQSLEPDDARTPAADPRAKLREHGVPPGALTSLRSVDAWKEAVATERYDHGDPASSARFQRGFARVLLGSLVIALTVAAGIVAGLQTFYFSGPWGTTEDYLIVVVAGVAGTALLQAVVDAVTKLLPALPDKLVQGPAAARAPVPPARPGAAADG